MVSVIETHKKSSRSVAKSDMTSGSASGRVRPRFQRPRIQTRLDLRVFLLPGSFPTKRHRVNLQEQIISMYRIEVRYTTRKRGQPHHKNPQSPSYNARRGRRAIRWVSQCCMHLCNERSTYSSFMDWGGDQFADMVPQARPGESVA